MPATVKPKIGEFQNLGATLSNRELFAGFALAGILANPEGPVSNRSAVQAAAALADLLIAELAK